MHFRLCHGCVLKYFIGSAEQYLLVNKEGQTLCIMPWVGHHIYNCFFLKLAIQHYTCRFISESFKSINKYMCNHKLCTLQNSAHLDTSQQKS